MLRDQRWVRKRVHWLAVLVVAGAFVAGALGGATPQVVLAQDDTLEANKALIASLYDEIVNNQNYEIVLDAVAPGMIEHTRDGDIVHETPEDYLAALTEEMAQYPGLAVTIDYQLAEDDLVANRVTVTLMDGQISTRGMSVFRIADGKIVEMEEILDEVAIANQMSATPGMAEEGTGQADMVAAEVLAEGFNGPMGILLDDEGNVWVVDSGVGGAEEVSMPSVETGEMMTVTIGETARIVMVAPDGTQTDVATLPSVLMGDEATGGSRLALLDGTLYATSGGWFEGIADERLPLMASVVAVGEDGSVEEIASTWDIEASENPGGFALDTHPYGLAAGPDGMLWVADAGANAVFKVDPESREISTVAVIDGVPIPLPNPERGDAMETDPVPTGVVPTEDGGAYVSLLPGFPFLPGTAKVVRISPEGEVSDYATGLTMITDLRMAPDGELYAVQLGEFTEQGPTANSGAIWRVREGDGSEIVFSGLSFPSSVDFNDAGDAFITINGVGAPGTGAVLVVRGLMQMSGQGAAEEMGAQGESEVLPVPETALGPEIPQDTGYLVEEIGDGLYWVTDGTYQIMFLTTGEGVIVVDAPPSMGEKILSAIADVTDEPITHVIYSHHHADHISGAGMYPEDATYIAQAETAARLEERGADDEAQELPFGVLVGGGPVPLPTVTFTDSYTLEVGSQTLELAYFGGNHSHGNTFIYAPAQKVLMVVDVVEPGWSPYRYLAASEDVPGYFAAHDQILAYDFDVYIGGHLARYGTREDVELQKEYLLDMRANALTALQTTDFMAIGAQTGFENPWLLFDVYFDALTQTCADLTIEKWGGVLAGVDVNTKGHCDKIVGSLRLD